jgi:hypothetical protein
MLAGRALLGIAIDPAERLAVHSSGAEPLQGALHLRLNDPKGPRRRNLHLDQPGALPLKAGDHFRIEAHLNRPAYIYLFWVGSDAKVAPIYPWRSGHWESRAAQERKRERLDLPEHVDRAWKIPPGSPGVETLVLLAREESPLPRKDEEALARLLSGARVRTDVLVEEAVWLENGREIRLDLRDRAVPSSKTRKSDDPVLGLRRLLAGKVQALGDYYMALIFPSAGGA